MDLSALRLSDKDALFFDCDGTLIDIADHPDNVVIPADLSSVFNTVSIGHGQAAAIITGRDMAFVDSIFDAVPASASHGAVIRRHQGGVVESLVETPEFDDLDDLLNSEPVRQKYDIPQAIWIEKKNFARSVHYRNLECDTGEVEPLIVKWAEAIADHYNKTHDGQLILTRGDAALELGPDGADKGRVLDEFMKAAPFSGRRPVYFGDSLADVPAMTAARSHGGVGVSVGPAATAHADFTARNPQQVRNYVRSYAQRRL